LSKLRPIDLRCSIAAIRRKSSQVT